MKILIFEPNEMLGKFLNDFMFSVGIIPMVVDEHTMILPQLKQGSYDILLSDYSTNAEDINNILFNIKLNKKISHTKIFITTPRPEKDVIENLIRLGICGFVKKPFQERQFKSAFELWLSRNSFSQEKRKHVRVSPQPADNAFMMIRTKYRNVDIKFSIIDISVGGVALIPPMNFQSFMLKCFSPGGIVKEVRLKIRHFGILVDMKVIHIKADRVCFEFINVSDKTYKYIYRYIAEYING